MANRDDFFLYIEELPEFIIVNDTGRKKIALSECGSKISWIANALSDIEENAIVGIIHRSDENLILIWMACLAARLRPMIIQYPNTKQNLLTYKNSLLAISAATGMQGVISTSALQSFFSGCALPADCPVIEVPPEIPEHYPPIIAIPHGHIIQMSSGTTGQRKPMVFGTRQINAHVHRFNEALELCNRDRIISWLPLYHDMGFIACFCMPLILGIPVIMMDPMTWVAQPERFFEIITRENATLCYMPNFGFEVMSRYRNKKMPSMRLWISCSEPILESTATKFMESVAIGDDKIATCYGMAENIFAVTFRVGLKSAKISGRSVVSCGSPISGTALKEKEGEIYVRSPESLKSYYAGEEIVDDDGYYKSGDVGHIIDGELYLFGRTGDIINQAGEKYFLNELDKVAEAVFPESKGHLAAIISPNHKMGTEIPLIVAESKDFFLRRVETEKIKFIQDETEIQQVQVQFVPPRFITKTSSGKVNRRETAKNIRLVNSRSGTAGAHEGGKIAFSELLSSFPGDQPVGAILDSLSQLILRMVLEQASISFEAKRTLDEYRQMLAESRPADDMEKSKAFNIVMLGDQRSFWWMNRRFLQRIEQIVGAPVCFTSVALPPACVILSDIVFMDYFLPRMEDDPSVREAAANISYHLSILKNASLIIVDDINDVGQWLNPNFAVPFLNHRFEKDSISDLIAVRWQQYLTGHHRLPTGYLGAAAVRKMGIQFIQSSFDALGQYLGCPILRVAFMPHIDDRYRPFAQGWDITMPSPINYLDFSDGNAAMITNMAAEITRYIALNKNKFEPRKRNHPDLVRWAEIPHFCCDNIDPDLVDMALDIFDSYIICGSPSSLPYLANKVSSLGKRAATISSHINISSDHERKYDCALLVGSMGDYTSSLPYFSLMSYGSATPVYGNLPAGVGEELKAELDRRKSFSRPSPELISEGFFQIG
jgi:acyl-CoA synthetase (AMP-forming)/AMP-acid ligase II